MALDLGGTALGREFDRVLYDPVTAEQLIAFARALGAGPEYTEPGPDLVAHPSFCVFFRGHRFFPDDLPAGLRARRSLDAGKDIELGVPIRPGDRITVVSTLHEVYEKTGRSGTMVFVVIRFTLTNHRDELVAHVDTRLMYRPEE